MRYISCFSGIGGLEASVPPLLFCEADPQPSSVLKTAHPDIEVWPDVTTLSPPKADIVAGGWPCQDISVAGSQEGLSGLRSRLLLDMLRVATEAGAHSVVAENVAHLLRMRDGAEFTATLAAFDDAGYPFVGWRIINAREFGLPQHRTRLLIIGSTDSSTVETLFRPFPELDEVTYREPGPNSAAGFYWTAGTHSINYSRGYVPTIKIGSSLGIPSPPAVHYRGVVRMLSAGEALRLQGFLFGVEQFGSASSAFRAAGNAVAAPVGRWVMDGTKLAGAVDHPEELPMQDGFWGGPPDSYPKVGVYRQGKVTGIGVANQPKATNLDDFLDHESEDRLSRRASRGLLDRLARSGQVCPPDLRRALEDLATEGAGA